MSNRCSLFIAVLVTAGLASAQEWRTVAHTELLAKLDASAAKVTALDRYVFRSSLMAYRSERDVQPMETTTSVVWKDGDRVKAEHMGFVSYQDKKLRVTVDQEDRVLIVAEPQGAFDLLDASYRASVFEAAAIGKREGAGGVTYRARYGPGSDFTLLEFQFDRTGWLSKLTVHWGHAVSALPEQPMTDVFTPVVVLEMALPQPFPSGSVRLDVGEAVLLTAGALQPAQRYAGYTVIDNRWQP